MSRSHSPQWQALANHYQQLSSQQIATLMAVDPDRFSHFSLRFEGILLDYSKNLITTETIPLLQALAESADLVGWRNRLLSGERINHTEGRAVLHTALRSSAEEKIEVDGESVVPAVHRVLQQMERFVDQIHTQEWRGHTDQAITDIVNIGIGGSDLGPRMVVHALQHWHHPALRSHFVSNLDGRELQSVLQQVTPETTLFIIASKTFTTLETMTNANSARSWFLQNGGSEPAIARHFVALSTDIEATTAFGIAPDNVFPFWDWVGGRYSLWSAIGLSIALALGMETFRALQGGARAMDQHFATAPLPQNMPVILALIGIWNINFLGHQSQAVIPYDSALALFPAYLQQLDMESNGKQVDRSGNEIDHQTSPLLWGEPGSNGQHSFFQFLHQSRVTVPLDFIGTIRPGHTLPHHHDRLTANMLAQAEALMRGRTTAEAREELLATRSPEEAERLAPYKHFPGNTPSNLLLLDQLDPHTLGSLLALYEHKVFVQGVIWDLNSFDQMGVELGKALAKKIQHELEQETVDHTTHDPSTSGLLSTYLQRNLPPPT